MDEKLTWKITYELYLTMMIFAIDAIMVTRRKADL